MCSVYLKILREPSSECIGVLKCISHHAMMFMCANTVLRATWGDFLHLFSSSGRPNEIRQPRCECQLAGRRANKGTACLTYLRHYIRGGGLVFSQYKPARKECIVTPLRVTHTLHKLHIKIAISGKSPLRCHSWGPSHDALAVCTWPPEESMCATAASTVLPGVVTLV